MVRGENVLGHTAPFPESVPALLLDRMRPGETVLEPFSGSMTTGRAAYKRGLKSVNIDHLREYCDLGIRLLEQETRTLSLFGVVDGSSAVART
jgi:DNA modification methylase